MSVFLYEKVLETTTMNYKQGDAVDDFARPFADSSMQINYFRFHIGIIIIPLV